MSLRVRLGLGLERLFDLGEVVGHQRTVIGKRTARVDEGKHDDASAILMEADALVVLIFELEIRNLVARVTTTSSSHDRRPAITSVACTLSPSARSFNNRSSLSLKGMVIASI